MTRWNPKTHTAHPRKDKYFSGFLFVIWSELVLRRHATRHDDARPDNSWSRAPHLSRGTLPRALVDLQDALQNFSRHSLATGIEITAVAISRLLVTIHSHPLKNPSPNYSVLAQENWEAF